jgi:hypothetical protein
LIKTVVELKDTMPPPMPFMATVATTLAVFTADLLVGDVSTRNVFDLAAV